MLFWFFTACLTPQEEILSPTCDPRTLESGELRGRLLLCSEEEISDGESRRGEFLLENSMLRFTVRSPPNSLTQFAAGGSIIDIAAPGSSDFIQEILPMKEGLFLNHSTLELNTTEEAVTLSITNEEQVLSYSISPDRPEIFLQGMDAVYIVPDAGTHRIGNTLYSPYTDLVIHLNGSVTDYGGHLVFESPDSIVLSSAYDVWKWRDDEAILYTLESQIPTIRFFDINEQLISELNSIDGYIEGYIPSTAVYLQPYKEGCLAQELQLLGSQINDDFEVCGKIKVRVQDDNGTSIPATLLYGEESIPIPAAGLMLPMSETIDGATIMAGPQYESLNILQINPTQEPQIDVSLKRAAPDHLLFQPFVICSPDQSTRETTDEIAQRLIGLGIDFSLCTGQNIVPDYPKPTPHIEEWITLLPGSQTLSTPLVHGWPWTQTLRDEGYGAIPEFLTENEMLDFAGKTGRNTIVDSKWVESNSPPWDTQPDFLYIDSKSDIPLYHALLQQQVPIHPLAPYTSCLRLTDETHHPIDIETELRREHVALGNGPVVILHTQGKSNGDVASPSPVHAISISVYAPQWMSLNSLRLWGELDAPLREWQIEGAQTVVHSTKLKSSFFFAEVTGISEIDGSELWGLSAPVFIQD